MRFHKRDIQNSPQNLTFTRPVVVVVVIVVGKKNSAEKKKNKCPQSTSKHSSLIKTNLKKIFIG
jgi:hypothetical protein